MSLLPCPFCGKPAEVLAQSEGAGKPVSWRTECTNPRCPVNACTYRERTPDESERAWNTRVPPVIWKPASEPPATVEDFYAFKRSLPVLCTDGKTTWVGFLQRWEGDEYSPEWREWGRDEYLLFRITHWAELPALPGKEVESWKKLC